MSRPLSVILISALFIISGISGIIYHAAEWTAHVEADAFWALAVRLLAIVGGIFAFKGANWARWLLVAWIVYHVFLSFFHTTGELIIHIVVTLLVIAALFNRKTNRYFGSTKPSP